MCARFSLVASVAEIESFLGAEFEADLDPRANIAPTLQVPGLVETAHGKQIKLLRWGLIPSWADDPSIGSRLINARAETALEKPAFREAMRQRRCVIPAGGFYEWREESLNPPLDLGLDPAPVSGGKTRKQPYFFHRRDGEMMGFAGLWERWKGSGDALMTTFTILTTEPNSLLAPFHDRMPCILDRTNFELWIDPTEKPESVLPLLQSLPSEAMAFEMADPKLNNPRFEPCAA